MADIACCCRHAESFSFRFLNTELSILRCLSVLPKFTDFVGKPRLRDVKVYRSGDRPCLKIPGKLLTAPQHLQG
ncbi:hypothetical protein QUA00_21860 [Microcoleus sp. T2B6]|uniref:hypothetical protein n=1 Tax=unclassified Microcoleus TaxID=2642155 RepID=UPI002FD23344